MSATAVEHRPPSTLATGARAAVRARASRARWRSCGGCADATRTARVSSATRSTGCCSGSPSAASCRRRELASLADVAPATATTDARQPRGGRLRRALAQRARPADRARLADGARERTRRGPPRALRGAVDAALARFSEQELEPRPRCSTARARCSTRSRPSRKALSPDRAGRTPTRSSLLPELDPGRRHVRQAVEAEPDPIAPRRPAPSVYRLRTQRIVLAA